MATRELWFVYYFNFNSKPIYNLQTGINNRSIALPCVSVSLTLIGKPNKIPRFHLTKRMIEESDERLL